MPNKRYTLRSLFEELIEGFEFLEKERLSAENNKKEGAAENDEELDGDLEQE